MTYSYDRLQSKSPYAGCTSKKSDILFVEHIATGHRKQNTFATKNPTDPSQIGIWYVIQSYLKDISPNLCHDEEIRGGNVKESRLYVERIHLTTLAYVQSHKANGYGSFS